MASLFDKVFGSQIGQNSIGGRGLAAKYDAYNMAMEAQLRSQSGYIETMRLEALARMNAAGLYGYSCLGQSIKGDGGGRFIEEAPLKKKPASYREELQAEINEWLR